MSEEGTRNTAGTGVWAIRASVLAVSFSALLLAQIEDDRFRETAASALRFDVRQWSATITPLIFAGALFTIAARFPFPRPRYAWSRLVLAVLALLPELHVAFVMWSPQFDVRWPSFIITPRWFDSGSVPAMCAVLAGVAIGAGFGARLETLANDDRLVDSR
jgi:hypothetical protein